MKKIVLLIIISLGLLHLHAQTLKPIAAYSDGSKLLYEEEYTRGLEVVGEDLLFVIIQYPNNEVYTGFVNRIKDKKLYDYQIEKGYTGSVYGGNPALYSLSEMHSPDFKFEYVLGVKYESDQEYNFNSQTEEMILLHSQDEWKDLGKTSPLGKTYSGKIFLKEPIPERLKWWYNKVDFLASKAIFANLTFKSNGTGSSKLEMSEYGFSEQRASESWRNSNWTTSYNLIGGYGYTVDAIMNGTFTWSVKDDSLYIKFAKPSTTITATPDIESSSSAAWKRQVKADAATNPDIRESKSKMQKDIKDLRFDLKNKFVIFAMTDDIIILLPEYANGRSFSDYIYLTRKGYKFYSHEMIKLLDTRYNHAMEDFNTMVEKLKVERQNMINAVKIFLDEAVEQSQTQSQSFYGEGQFTYGMYSENMLSKLKQFFPIDGYTIDSIAGERFFCTIEKRIKNNRKEYWKTTIKAVAFNDGRYYNNYMVDLNQSFNVREKVRSIYDDIDDLESQISEGEKTIKSLAGKPYSDVYSNYKALKKSYKDKIDISDPEEIIRQMQHHLQQQAYYLKFIEERKKITANENRIAEEAGKEYADITKTYQTFSKSYNVSITEDSTESFDRLNRLMAIQQKYLEFITLRKTISNNSNTIREQAGKDFADVTKTYQNFAKKYNTAITEDIDESFERLNKLMAIQQKYLEFITLRKTISNNSNTISEQAGKDFADVTKAYQNFAKKYNTAITEDIDESFERLNKLIQIQSKCLEFTTLRKTIAQNNADILAQAKTCKNITKIYSTYFKNADISWNADDNAQQKLQDIIANQNVIKKAVTSSNASDLDAKVKKLKDKSIESVKQAIQ